MTKEEFLKKLNALEKSYTSEERLGLLREINADLEETDQELKGLYSDIRKQLDIMKTIENQE